MSHSPDNSPFSARSAISLVAGAALLFAVFASSAHIHVEDEHESREEGPVCELCIIADRLDDAIGGLEAGLVRSAGRGHDRSLSGPGQHCSLSHFCHTCARTSLLTALPDRNPMPARCRHPLFDGRLSSVLESESCTE